MAIAQSQPRPQGLTKGPGDEVDTKRLFIFSSMVLQVELQAFSKLFTQSLKLNEQKIRFSNHFSD